MSSDRLSSFHEETYINKFNQFIRPGDRVAVVSTGYSHNINEYMGVFKGVRKINGKVVSVQVRKTDGGLVCTLPARRIFKISGSLD